MKLLRSKTQLSTKQASTHITDARQRLRNTIFRLGSQPHKSWQQFKIGLAIFALGTVLILFGPKMSVLLQIPGVVILAIGLFWAAKGYIGIFANRFAQTLNRAAPPSFEDK